MKSVISAEPNRVTWSNLANHPKPWISLVEDTLKLAQRGTTNPAGSFHKLNFWRRHNPPPWLWGVFWVTFSKQDDDNSSHLYGLYRIIFTGYLKTHFCEALIENRLLPSSRFANGASLRVRGKWIHGDFPRSAGETRLWTSLKPCMWDPGPSWYSSFSRAPISQRQKQGKPCLRLSIMLQARLGHCEGSAVPSGECAVLCHSSRRSLPKGRGAIGPCPMQWLKMRRHCGNVFPLFRQPCIQFSTYLWSRAFC